MKSFTRIQRAAWSLTALLLLMVSNTFAADPPNIVFILSDDQAWNDYGFIANTRGLSPCTLYALIHNVPSERQ